MTRIICDFKSVSCYVLFVHILAAVEVAHSCSAKEMYWKIFFFHLCTYVAAGRKQRTFGFWAEAANHQATHRKILEKFWKILLTLPKKYLLKSIFNKF